jgi:secreted trypsin-like serine protease
LNRNCGNRRGVGGLVFGGSEIRRGDWPWLAALVHKPKNTFFCMGTLISKTHVLTSKQLNLKQNKTRNKKFSFAPSVK